MAELVDILKPPTFEKTGEFKTLEEAWNSQDWIGVFNLWILRKSPVPSIVYQMRSPKSSWAPGKLDVTAGGHYSKGETIEDGLREVREELGKNYNFGDLKFLGRKINVSKDVKNRERRNLVDIFFITDDAPLESYVLQEEEVYAICACPIKDLIKVHNDKTYSFDASALNYKSENINLQVDYDSFPYNWDNYHYKIALLGERFLKGEKNLIY